MPGTEVLESAFADRCLEMACRFTGRQWFARLAGATAAECVADCEFAFRSILEPDIDRFPETSRDRNLTSRILTLLSFSFADRDEAVSEVFGT